MVSLGPKACNAMLIGPNAPTYGAPLLHWQVWQADSCADRTAKTSHLVRVSDRYERHRPCRASIEASGADSSVFRSVGIVQKGDDGEKWRPKPVRI